MRVSNETPWSTRDLRAIFTRVMNDEGLEASTKNRLRVTVKTHRRGSYAGRAHLKLHWIKLLLPLPKHGPAKSSWIAYVFAHELHHAVYGKTHSEMRGSKYSGWPLDLWSKYAGMPVAATVPQGPARLGREAVVAGKVVSLAAAIKRLQAKRKRLDTLIRKRAVSLRYYEKQAAAIRGTMPPAIDGTKTGG